MASTKREDVRRLLQPKVGRAPEPTWWLAPDDTGLVTGMQKPYASALMVTGISISTQKIALKRYVLRLLNRLFTSAENSRRRTIWGRK
jgi:hypothetical protein